MYSTYPESLKVVQSDLDIAISTDQSGAVSTTLHYCSVSIDTGLSALGPGFERHDFPVIVRCGYELDFCLRVEDESKAESSWIYFDVFIILTDVGTIFEVPRGQLVVVDIQLQGG